MALVNPNIAMSFRQPEFKPRNAMAEYAQMQKVQMDDMTLQRIQEDRAELIGLRARLRAAGRSDDPQAFFKALKESDNPDLIAKGIEGEQRYKAVQAYDLEFGPRAAASTMPKSAPGAMVAPSAPAPRTERGVDIYGKPVEVEVNRGIAPPGAMGQPLAPFGAAAPAPAAPTAPINAIAPVSAMPDVNALRRQYSMAVAAGSPDAPVILKQVEAALRGDQNRTTLSDRFVPVGKLVFDRQDEKFISPPQGTFEERPTTAARVAAPSASAAQGKPMTALQQQAFRKGMAADKTNVKASQSVVNELEKLTDELVGNPEKKIAPHPGLSGITGIQAMLPSLPESLVTSGNARKAQQRLETLKGKVMAFGRQLASLEGKLGNMAVQEWKFVSDSIQAIDPAAGNLDVQLRDIVRQAKNFANTVQERYDLTYEADGAPAEPTAAPTATPPRAGGNAPAAGGLSPAEQAELDQLRKRFRK